MKLKTFKTEIWSACALEVEAGTNTPQGGDGGHGGRTYIRLTDIGGTDMKVRISKQGTQVELIFGGDAEAWVVRKALLFIWQAMEPNQLVSQTGEVCL